jgi:hypothetical protein
MAAVTVQAKKLDVKIGDLVEIDGRRYDVVSDEAGEVACSRRSRRPWRSCAPSGVAGP